MQGVSSRHRRVVAVCLLVVVLLAPAAYGSETSGDASLWEEFLAWLTGEPDGTWSADEAGFTTWLNYRLSIPGG